MGDVASLVLSDQRIWFVSNVFLICGLVTALAAMTAGLFELRKILGDSPAMRVAYWHMSLAMITWAVYALSLYMRWNGVALVPDGVAIGLSVLGFALLAAAGWLGGTLVYGYGIGVEEDE